MNRTLLLALPFVVVACPEPEPQLAWYATCGDPSCGGYSGPHEDVALCTDEVEGGTCSAAGATCDPVSDCNALLTCAVEDPKDQVGGCPISRRRYKRDIHVLSSAEREAAASGALAIGLSTWNYAWEAPGSRAHLGFIIDDHEGSAAVAADGEHVDLYGYTSMTLAAVQADHAVLMAQRVEIAQLRAEIEALKAVIAAPR